MISLRLINFKSFGDVKVPILGQHVAVLGPNHAGKSNLLDAIQFVLGFDVSDRGDLLTRGVVEAVDSTVQAEFQIDGEVITLARTQAGLNSTYYINRTQVSSEAYRSRVEIILGSKGSPAIRQNAGGFYEGQQLIDYLESHVTSAELLQEYTHAFDRLQTLQQEAKHINSKVSQQRRVVSQAQQDNADQEEYERLETEFRECWRDKVVWELLEQRNAYSRASAALAKLENAREKAALDIQQAQEAVRQGQMEVQEAELCVFEKEQAVQQVKHHLELDLAHERAQVLTEKRVLERKLQNVSEQREQLNQNIAKQDLEKQELSSQIKAYERLAEQQKKLPTEYADILKKFEQDNAELLAFYAEKKHQMKRARDVQQLREDQLSQQIQKTDQVQEQIKQQQNTIAELETTQLRQQETITGITKETNVLKTQIAENQVKTAAILDRLPQINRQIETSGELQKEIQLEKRFSDILKHIQRPGVLGYVRDVFSTQEAAAQFILKSFQYSLIVDGFDTIGELLPSLRQLKCQLQLFPLDKLKFSPESYQRQHSQMLKKCQEFARTKPSGSLQPLIDVVKFRAEYLPVAAHFLGDVYLYKGRNIEEARAFSRQERARVVTEDCVLLGVSGQISVQLQGFSNVRNVTSGPQVDRNLPQEKARLESSLQELQNQTNAKTARLQALQAAVLPEKSLELKRTEARLQASSAQLRLLNQRLQEEQKSTAAAEKEAEHAAQEAEKSANDARRVLNDVQQRREEVLGPVLQKHGLSQQEAAQLQEQRPEDRRLPELQRRLEALSGSGLQKLLEGANGFLVDTRRQIGVVEEKMLRKDAEITETQQRHAEMTSELAALQSQRQKALERLMKAQENLQKTASASTTAAPAAVLVRDKEAAAQKIVDLMGIIYVEKLPVQAEEDEETAGGNSRKSQKKISKKERQDAKKQQTTALLAKIQNALSTEHPEAHLDELRIALQPQRQDYQARYTELQEQLKQKTSTGRRNINLQQEEETLSVLEKEAAETKKKTHAAQTRFQTLLKERSSALNGLVESLKDVLSEVYRILSGFGLAFLQVNDPVQPFKDGGIELMVQPPGDQVRKASETSGGEQGLLRLALLIAIGNVLGLKMLLFDEADQNLDGDKIERLKTVISGYGNQVIFVTHNESLAAAAEALVGVTQRGEELSRVFYLRSE